VQVRFVLILVFICISLSHFSSLSYTYLTYGHPSLSVVNWFQKNRVLSETALSEGTFSIRINGNRSNLYSHHELQC
jgi:hypothetical protein